MVDLGGEAAASSHQHSRRGASVVGATPRRAAFALPQVGIRLALLAAPPNQPAGGTMPELVELFAVHGYWVLAVTVLLESAGVPLPGETAVLAAGYLTSPDGGERFHVWAVIAVAFVAAVVGDNLGFWLGREFARPRLAAGRRFLLLTPARLELAERYFTRYGAATVFIARFVAILRMTAGPAAGVSGMPWPKFLAANAAGALAWAASMAMLGHWCGHAWEALRRWVGRGAWAVAGVALLAFVIWWAYAKFWRGPGHAAGVGARA
jgi:membrane-associated protein